MNWIRFDFASIVLVPLCMAERSQRGALHFNQGGGLWLDISEHRAILIIIDSKSKRVINSASASRKSGVAPFEPFAPHSTRRWLFQARFPWPSNPSARESGATPRSWFSQAEGLLGQERAGEPSKPQVSK